MTRFAYAEATIIILAANQEFSAAVTVDGEVLSWRTPEDPTVVVAATIEHIWPDGKKWHAVTTEFGEVTVQRKGGCNCR